MLNVFKKKINYLKNYRGKGRLIDKLLYLHY